MPLFLECFFRRQSLCDSFRRLLSSSICRRCFCDGFRQCWWCALAGLFLISAATVRSPARARTHSRRHLSGAWLGLNCSYHTRSEIVVNGLRNIRGSIKTPLLIKVPALAYVVSTRRSRSRSTDPGASLRKGPHPGTASGSPLSSSIEFPANACRSGPSRIASGVAGCLAAVWREFAPSRHHQT